MIVTLHLDCVRSFIPMDELKSKLKFYSECGVTHLQLGISDDQGWRVEMDSYPRLHEIGSMRAKEVLRSDRELDDSVPYGGYYTKDELRELVMLASSYNMEIIPLVNLPGHASTIIYCYPELSSGKVPEDIPTDKGISLFTDQSSTVCYTSEEVRKFIHSVYTELSSIFPSKYFHIGFDEICSNGCKRCNNCNVKTLNELLHYCFDTLKTLNKTPIVWYRGNSKDPSFDLVNYPEVILQYWGRTFLRLPKGNPVIYSNPDALYFDYPIDFRQRLIQHDDMGPTYVDPIKLVRDMKRLPSNVVGYGVCLWTENLITEDLRTDFLDSRLITLRDVLKKVEVPKRLDPLSILLRSSYLGNLARYVKSHFDYHRGEPIEIIRELSEKSKDGVIPLVRFAKNEVGIDINTVMPLNKLPKNFVSYDPNYPTLRYEYDT